MIQYYYKMSSRRLFFFDIILRTHSYISVRFMSFVRRGPGTKRRDFLPRVRTAWCNNNNNVIVPDSWRRVSALSPHRLPCRPVDVRRRGGI